MAPGPHTHGRAGCPASDTEGNQLSSAQPVPFLHVGFFHRSLHYSSEFWTVGFCDDHNFVVMMIMMVGDGMFRIREEPYTPK